MTFGVIGAGTMGQGIAQVAACSGHRVVLIEKNENTLISSRDKLSYFINRLAEKGKMTDQEAKEAFGNIHFSQELASLSDAEFVIEAIVENLEVKKAVFKNIEAIVSEKCILASNTSSLAITAIAASLNHPDRFLGVHFFNPAPLMKLVEIIPGLESSESVVHSAVKTISDMGKLTVLAKDTPAFIVNRVARPFYGEALRIAEEGLADPITIDYAMKEIGGFRMGPFELMDYIGHDINYKVTQTVFEAFYYDRRYTPSFLQKSLVEAGRLGRKTGKGFYDYGNDSIKPEPSNNPKLHKDIVHRIVVMLINEAAEALYRGVASKEDIDLAMTKGTNYPKGLFKWADEISIPSCVETLDRLFEEYHEERYRCSPLLRNMQRESKSFY